MRRRHLTYYTLSFNYHTFSFVVVIFDGPSMEPKSKSQQHQTCHPHDLNAPPRPRPPSPDRPISLLPSHGKHAYKREREREAEVDHLHHHLCPLSYSKFIFLLSFHFCNSIFFSFHSASLSRSLSLSPCSYQVFAPVVRFLSLVHLVTLS